MVHMNRRIFKRGEEGEGERGTGNNHSYHHTHIHFFHVFLFNLTIARACVLSLLSLCTFIIDAIISALSK